MGGNNLQVSKTSSQPTVSYSDAESSQLYTVAMVDPDAPSRNNPRAAQWIHWIVINVDGKTLLSGEDLRGDEVTEYAGPSPPRGSGPHRYVLLVWEQHHSVSMDSPRSRARGDISKIVKSLDLKEPVAGNFFLTENK